VTPTDRDRFVLEGTAEVRRLVEQGHREASVDVAVFVARTAYGTRAVTGLRPRMVAAVCSACGRRALLNKRWCRDHAPTFDRKNRVAGHRCVSCRRIDAEGAPDADGAWVCGTCWREEARRDG
jgi:hypothetical protein